MTIKKTKPVAPAPKKRGRPVGSTAKPVNWEQLAKKLQRALAAEIKKNDELEWGINVYRQVIDSQLETISKLENRSWLSRTFNLKG